VRPASAAEKARLADTFAELCRIPSPSGQEAACAERVAAELRRIGTAPEADEAGNLLARLPGRGERTLLLCAHMDTVHPAAPIEPVVVEDGWENANDGILGADNKAAVAVTHAHAVASTVLRGRSTSTRRAARWASIAASTSPANNGWARCGRDLNSGWAWVET